MKFLSQLSDSIRLSCQIEGDLFDKYEVKRGLRNKYNTGVLVGLTNIGSDDGVGHAVFTISDPRAKLLKEKARELALEKNRYDEFQLYDFAERITPGVFSTYKGEKNGKVVCINVDFYSGFVYPCIGISKELFTRLFAMARIAGWCTHRIEKLTFSAKRIIKPGFKHVFDDHSYAPIGERKYL